MDDDKTRLHDGKPSAADPTPGLASASYPDQDETRLASDSDPASRSSLSRRPGQDTRRNQATSTNIGASGLTVGEVLKERFRLVELIGEGGMGMVFKAVDIRKLEAKSRNPYVAIKVLNPALAQDTVLVAGLQRECEKAQELSHPNIITVYDFDRDGDYVFMSMEYLVGRPLSQIIRSSAGGVRLDRAWPIIRNMGAALAYAHKKNIVHSDFKPANVFVTDKDEVKVLDFGIASRAGQADTDETVFNARAEGGMTPPYASFEMLNGSRADPRDDIYAFGLVVYELLTGKHPYNRQPASTVFLEQRSGRGAMPPAVGGLSRKQWQLLKAAIEILQEQRPSKLDDWLQEFDPKHNSKAWYPAAGGVAALLIGVAWFGYYQWWPARTDSEQTPATSSEPQAQVKPSIEPPLADAGGDIRAIVGEAVNLNGAASRSFDGGPLNYSWRLIARPAGSNSLLAGTETASPQFIPDQPGNYKAELIVTDAGNRASAPVFVAIDVERPALVPSQQPALMHESTSQDGVLSLAAAKPQYRIGEELQLSLSSAKAGYLRVAYLSSTGEINDLLPNKYQPSKIKAGITYRIPPKAGTFKLQVTGPVGVDKIIAVFSESPIPAVKAIANSDGSLVDALKSLTSSAAVIRFSVLAKG